jgi:DNA modification methylase
MFSQKDDIILDTFMGSGTTALACLQEGRNFLGCERDETYCKIANDRIKDWKNDLQRQDEWLEKRGVMDFKSDIQEEIKKEGVGQGELFNT